MEIQPKWQQHPLAKEGRIELVPTDWLYEIYGHDVTPETDLKDGSLVDMETLWQNIKDEGMYDPVIIRVGAKNKKFRLESGNHRVQMFKKYKVPFMPATVQIQDECGPHVDNVMTDATHNFDFAEDIITSNLKNGYMRPTEVFGSLIGKVQSF